MVEDPAGSKVDGDTTDGEDDADETVPAAVDPRTLVQYQPEAIVSRTILDGEGGTVTAFAFDADQGLSEHSAPHEAFLQVLDGTALVQLDGTERAVRAGEAIRLPAGVPHAVDATERMRMLLTMIR